MDQADCSIGTSPRYAALLGEEEANALRGRFSCSTCRGRAWYVSRGRDGKAPHFAGHHEEGCPYKNERVGDPWGDGSDGETNEQINRGQVIKLELGGQADESGQSHHSQGTMRGGRSYTMPAGNNPREGVMHRRLSTILRLLVTVPEFRDSHQLLVLGSSAAVPVRNFFRALETACAPNSSLGFGGYWGRISSISRSEGGGSGPQYWLHTYGAHSIDCHLNESFLQPILERYHLSVASNLVGGYFLIIKSPYVMRNGKYALKIADLSAFAFRRG